LVIPFTSTGNRTHLQRIWPVVVLGNRKIHELIDELAAAGRVVADAELSAGYVASEAANPRDFWDALRAVREDRAAEAPSSPFAAAAGFSLSG
jgi:hypothetical protein